MLYKKCLSFCDTVIPIHHIYTQLFSKKHTHRHTHTHTHVLTRTHTHKNTHKVIENASEKIDKPSRESLKKAKITKKNVKRQLIRLLDYVQKTKQCKISTENNFQIRCAVIIFRLRLYCDYENTVTTTKNKGNIKKVMVCDQVQCPGAYVKI